MCARKIQALVVVLHAAVLTPPSRVQLVRRFGAGHRNDTAPPVPIVRHGKGVTATPPPHLRGYAGPMPARALTVSLRHGLCVPVQVSAIAELRMVSQSGLVAAWIAAILG